LHALTESHVVEIVDGELVVTPLGASAAPVLRLATGIRAAWANEACACGSDLPVLVLEGADTT
jgi:phenylacetate-coenzyme A ligase PaaK-like adenylate-forming protein